MHHLLTVLLTAASNAGFVKRGKVNNMKQNKTYKINKKPMLKIFTFALYYCYVFTLFLFQHCMYAVLVDVNAAAGAMNRQWSTASSKATKSDPSPSLVTEAGVGSTKIDGDPPMNGHRAETAVRRSVSDKQARHVVMDAVDSSSELLDFLTSGDVATGRGEFVRSASQRCRRRSRMPFDGLNESRERATPSPGSASATSDSDDLPPALSRGGPGRWSLRDRGTWGPPLKAQWARQAAPPNTDSHSSRHSSSRRSITEDCTVAGVEHLLSCPVNTLEQRRRERLPHHSASPVTDVDDAQPRSSGALSRWSPTINDSPTTSQRHPLIDDQPSLQRWKTGAVDRAILEVEKTGQEIDSVLSNHTVVSCIQENGYQRVSDTERGVTPDRRLNRCPENEQRRRCAVFDVDDDNYQCRLQRSTTLPQRWRYENPGRQTSNVDERMKEIPEYPPGESGTSSMRSGRVLDSCGAAVESLDGAPFGASRQRRLPAVIVSSRVASADSALALVTPDGSQSGSLPTSRPTSEEFDDVSTSSSSRDEGFESAVDAGGQSAWTDSDFGVQPPSGPQGPHGLVKSEATTPCEGDDSVSAGTKYFARSNDSLVAREFVLSGDTIDVDHYDEPHNITNSTEVTAVVPTEDVQSDQPDNGPRVSGSKKKSSSDRSSWMSNLTARLTRPKQSSSVKSQTGSSTGADTKQSSSTRRGFNDSPVSGAGAKTPALVRGSTLRATMPASLRTRKSSPSTNVSKDLLSPEPPPRSTSIRDVRSSQRPPSATTTRQQRTTATSSRKPQRETTARAEKQVTQQSAAASGRGRASVGEQSKTRSSGRDKLVLYKVVEKSPSSNTNGTVPSKKPASNEAHRTPRLVSFNTPQQSRTFWF